MMAKKRIDSSSLDLAMEAVQGICELVPVATNVWKYVYSDGSVLVGFPWERYVGLNKSATCLCEAGDGHSAGCQEKVSAV